MDAFEKYMGGSNYSAFVAFMTVIEKQGLSPKNKPFFKGVLKKTGLQVLNSMTDQQLVDLDIEPGYLVAARRKLIEKKYTTAIKLLNKVTSNSYLYPETLLLKSTAYSFLGRRAAAIWHWDLCDELTLKYQKFADSAEERKYYQIIKENCAINYARDAYKLQQYEKAITLYNKVPKKSYQWPYILLEKAWTYYQLEDFNRSLGVLLTYNSPLLESYFSPEAEVLKALNYFKLCLYSDSMNVINNFYELYKNRSEKLREIIGKGKKDPLYYFNLTEKPIKEIEKENRFFRNVMTKIKRSVKYSLDYQAMKKLEHERITLNNTDLDLLLFDFRYQISHFTKRNMYKFINQFHSLSKEMFNIRLEIITKQKDLLYEQKKLSADRSRGNKNNVSKSKYEDFWIFKDSFWADELGDYSLGLDSMCKTVKSGFSL